MVAIVVAANDFSRVDSFVVGAVNKQLVISGRAIAAPLAYLLLLLMWGFQLISLKRIVD